MARKRMKKRNGSRRTQRLTAEEKRHLAWKAARPCVWDGRQTHRCDGPVQVAHFRDMTGTGRKEGARMTIPLCRSVHEQYDQAKGAFEGFSRDERKRWFLNWVNTLNVVYDYDRGAVDVEEMP